MQMEQNLEKQLKYFLESHSKEYGRMYVKEGFCNGAFQPDLALCDDSGVPRVFFEVRQKGRTNSTFDDIRSWKAKYLLNEQCQDIKLILAEYEKNVWHFLDVNNKEIPLGAILASEQSRESIKIVNWPFYVVGAVLAAICLLQLFAPILFNNHCCGLVLSREVVILLCAAGISFLLPALLPYIKEVRWKGGVIVLTHDNENDNKY